MTAYVVAQLTITDRAAYRRYQGAFPAILARFGGRLGRLRAADDHARVVEGTWPYDRIVLIEFAGQQDLDAWAASGDYQRIAADRRAGSRGIVLTIRGLDDPASRRTTR
jgi:uncharacterized protein (DUF1330 family)